MNGPFDENTDSRYLEETKTSDRAATPIENATMALEIEEGKLYEMTTELARRLAPVLKRKYNQEAGRVVLADAPSKDVDSHSQLVRQIDSCKNRTRSTTEIIDFLLLNIEV